MAGMSKAALYGIAAVILGFLLAGGLPLLRKHTADLVVFVSFVTGILLISHALTRNRGGRK